MSGASPPGIATSRHLRLRSAGRFRYLLPARSSKDS
jgi:hypothetical protein